MKKKNYQRILNKTKKMIDGCINYEEDEKSKMSELQLVHLREKHHYKMRAYRWIMKEINRIEDEE